jgi:hypothetical protein
MRQSALQQLVPKLGNSGIAGAEYESINQSIGGTGTGAALFDPASLNYFNRVFYIA